MLELAGKGKEQGLWDVASGSRTRAGPDSAGSDLAFSASWGEVGAGRRFPPGRPGADALKSELRSLTLSGRVQWPACAPALASALRQHPF